MVTCNLHLGSQALSSVFTVSSTSEMSQHSGMCTVASHQEYFQRTHFLQDLQIQEQENHETTVNSVIISVTQGSDLDIYFCIIFKRFKSWKSQQEIMRETWVNLEQFQKTNATLGGGFEHG